MSDSRPVASVAVSYDSTTGFYSGGAASIIVAGDEPGLMGARVYGGFARRLDADTGIDVGLIGYRYTERYSGDRDEGSIEGYAGITRGAFSSYLHYTPSYFGRGLPVIYVDLGMTRELAANWQANAHVGVTIKATDQPGLAGRDARYDARLGLGRAMRHYDLRADITWGAPDDGYFDGQAGGASALVLSISRAF